MLSKEEKQEIINGSVEKLLLMLPDVIGNLITNHMSKLKTNKDFYLKHPKLRDKKDLVASVIEMVEGRDPSLSYEDILTNAMPEIEKRIKQVKDLNIDSVTKPNRSLKDLSFDHGEL